MARVAPVLAIAIAITTSSASAQELTYQTYLIGTRAMGMGGAFTGMADDPSAAFHNPAGLGLILRSSTSANLSVTAVEGWTMRGGYGSITGPQDLEHDAIPSLPLFVGFVQKFGDEGRDGVRQHGIALSVVRPARVQRSFVVDVSDPARGLADSLRIEHEDTAQWYGVSYGVRVDPGLAFGLGAWVALRDLNHSEEQFVAGGIIPAGARRTADRLLARQTEATLSSIDLVLRFGVLWQVDPQWRVGLMVQPGSISFSSTGSVFTRFARTSGGEPPAIEELRFVEQQDLPGDAPMPWQLRLGASHAFDESFALAADLALYAPIGSQNDPVETFGPAIEDPVTGEVPSPGRFVPRTWYANVTANLSIGFDALIEGVVPLQGGIFTDLSAAPSIDGPSPEYRSPQIHGLGASLAGGFHRGDFDAQIGVAGVYGWGTGLGTNPDADAPLPEAYLPRSMQRHSIYFFISGTERVAESLVREILGESGRDRDEEEDAEAEGAEGAQEGAARPPQREDDAGEDEAPSQEREEPETAQEREASLGPRYLRSPWRDLATSP